MHLQVQVVSLYLPPFLRKYRYRFKCRFGTYSKCTRYRHTCKYQYEYMHMKKRRYRYRNST